MMTTNVLASFMNLGGPDLIIILLIILLLFGAKKLPDLARGLGQAMKEFQKAKDEFSDELHKAGDAQSKPNVQQPQSTVVRTDNPPTPATQPDPIQNANPGKQADQV
jgi:sec-independent protein translocase protein TatA